jgi:hypothetical protein
MHSYLSSHRCQRWSDGHFRRTSLYTLGATVDFGHPRRAACDNPTSGLLTFTVIHTNGLHRLRVWYCGCEGAPSPFKQLLQRRLWPATTKNPRTVATFEVLWHFEILNAIGHTNATDFFQALAHSTDAKRQTALPVCYSHRLTSVS